MGDNSSRVSVVTEVPLGRGMNLRLMLDTRIGCRTTSQDCDVQDLEIALIFTGPSKPATETFTSLAQHRRKASVSRGRRLTAEWRKCRKNRGAFRRGSGELSDLAN
jgi:hypothetical protein